MAKLTKDGLRKVKGKLIQFAQRDDEELNAILQEAVRGLNNLITARSL